MTPEERRLVDVFMTAQAEPEGRMFSENILAGIKAVLNMRSTVPNNESVGPWKECVYKAKGAPASIEARIVVAAMLRLAEWRKENPEGLLPVQHHRAVRGVARELIEACLELEKSRTTATLRGIENG